QEGCAVLTLALEGGVVTRIDLRDALEMRAVVTRSAETAQTHHDNSNNRPTIAHSRTVLIYNLVWGSSGVVTGVIPRVPRIVSGLRCDVEYRRLLCRCAKCARAPRALSRSAISRRDRHGGALLACAGTQRCRGDRIGRCSPAQEHERLESRPTRAVLLACAGRARLRCVA